MEAFVIDGPARLDGAVTVGGAKNSALKLASAALLAPGTTRLVRAPDIADMRAMRAVLEQLGAETAADGQQLRVDVPDALTPECPADVVRALRASLVVLGPLLARCGRAELAMPGGCELGSRGVDLHLMGLRRMGAQVRADADWIRASAPDGLHGADIELPFASVGATENLLMAAVTARGRSRIANAAREPEIVDLAGMLTAMGAQVHGAGSDEVVVHGVDRLTPPPEAHEVVGDRIEAGTYAVAAAVAGGRVRVDGVDPAHLSIVLDRLAAAGCQVAVDRDGFDVAAPDRLAPFDVATLPYPGVPTDLQPMLLAVQSQAAGTSMLTENVFDGRFSVVDELRRMGADLDVEGHHVVVRGPARLRGARVRAPDLRAGAALVLAGLAAEGRTVVADAHHVDRGYPDLAGTLARLGGTVRRTSHEALAG